MKTKTNTVPECPECDRMGDVNEESQAQGEFLDWLQQEKHWTLCEPHKHTDECYTLGLTPKELVEQHGQHMHSGERADGRFCTPQYGMRDGQMMSVAFTTEKLLAEFHGIDLAKVEKEKRAVLDYIRKQKH
jgi:hypothetical protein